MEESGVQLLCFELCGEKFAFNLDNLVEIVRIQPGEITPWYSPVPIIRGKWNYRGQTLCVIDMREFFGLETPAATRMQEAGTHDLEQERGTKSILVVMIQNRLFGMLTDRVLQMQPLIQYYEYPALISTLPRRYFAGISMREAELVLLLAIEDFVRDYEWETLSQELPASVESSLASVA